MHLTCKRKFGLPTTIAQSGSTTPREVGVDRPVTIASLAAARRDPLLGRLTATNWDLVIFDEAHRLRSPRSASGKLARRLRARYLLMLTATPVENKLSDLYQLVSLVAPGLLLVVGGGSFAVRRRGRSSERGPGRGV